MSRLRKSKSVATPYAAQQADDVGRRDPHPGQPHAGVAPVGAGQRRELGRVALDRQAGPPGPEQGAGVGLGDAVAGGDVDRRARRDAHGVEDPADDGVLVGLAPRGRPARRRPARATWSITMRARRYLPDRVAPGRPPVPAGVTVSHSLRPLAPDSGAGRSGNGTNGHGPVRGAPAPPRRSRPPRAPRRPQGRTQGRRPGVAGPHLRVRRHRPHGLQPHPGRRVDTVRRLLHRLGGGDHRRPADRPDRGRRAQGRARARPRS